MNDSGSRKHKRRLILALLLLLPVLLVLLALQPFFIRAVILPRIAEATDSRIAVEDIRLAPLSRLSVTGLAYERNDQGLQVKAVSALIRYDLIAILKGNIRVDEITLTSPDITYTPTTPVPETRSPSPDSPTDTPSEPSPPPSLDIRNMNVVNGTLHLQLPQGMLHVSDLNFRLPSLMNGQPLRATLQASLIGEPPEQPGTPFMQGQIDANLELGLSDTLQPGSLTGTLNAVIGENLAGVPEMTLKLDTDLGVDIEKGLLDLRKFSLLALREGRPLLGLQLSNPTQVDWQQYPPTFTDCQLSLDLPRVDIPSLPFAQLLPIQSGQIHINSLLTVSNSGKKIDAALDFGLERLLLTSGENPSPLSLRDFSGKGTLKWTEGEDIAAMFALNVENLKLSDGKNLPSPLTLKLDTLANRDHATLNHLEISWAESPVFENRLRVEGNANWQDPQALNGHFTVRGQAIDLDPWAVFLVQPPPSAEAPAAAPPAPPATAVAVAESLQLPELPLEKMTLDVAVDKIHFKDLQLGQLELKAEAGKRQLGLAPLRFTLNGSTLNTRGKADWQHEDLDINLNASLSPLDLQPVFDSFVPDKKGAVTGKLQADTAFTINGNSVQTLTDSFQGQVKLAYTLGKIRLLNSDPEQHSALLHTRGFVQKVVSAMAETLQLAPEQLMEPEIESVTFDTEWLDRRLLIRQAMLRNPEFLMEASGEIQLADQAGDAGISKLPLVLGVSTNLAKRIKIYRPERVKGDYVVLPAFLEVTGSLKEPEIKVKKGVITGLVISGVTERNDIGNENVQKGLEILSTLLTGEAPPAKPTPTPGPAVPGAPPTPTPKPDKTEELIIGGLRLIQELRATPTPTPNP